MIHFGQLSDFGITEFSSENYLITTIHNQATQATPDVELTTASLRDDHKLTDIQTIRALSEDRRNIIQLEKLQLNFDTGK
jgi:hypothetical protein